MSIPKLSNPLTKGIRTLEGVLISVLAAATSIFSALDPHLLPPKVAAILVTIQGGTLAAQRGLIKAVAIQKGFGIGAPIDNARLDEALSKVEQIAQQHQNLINDIEHADLTKLTHLPSAAELDQLFKQLQDLANTPAPVATSTPPPAAHSGAIVEGPAPVPVSEPAPPADPAMDTAASITDEEEAAVQPSGQDVAADFPPPAPIADGSAVTPDPPVEAVPEPAPPTPADPGAPTA